MSSGGPVLKPGKRACSIRSVKIGLWDVRSPFREEFVSAIRRTYRTRAHWKPSGRGWGGSWIIQTDDLEALVALCKDHHRSVFVRTSRKAKWELIQGQLELLDPTLLN